MPDSTSNASIPAGLTMNNDPVVVVGNDFTDLGRLVETWARDPGNSEPKTLAAFKEEMSKVGVHLPARITDFKIMHEPKNAVYITVPHIDLIEAGKVAVDLDPDAYPIPEEYDRQARRPDPLPTRKQPNSVFLSFRIGEYCIGQCR